MELLETAFKVRGAVDGSGELYEQFESDVLLLVQRINEWKEYATFSERVDNDVKRLVMSILLEISIGNFRKINDIVSSKTLDAITTCLMFNLEPGEVTIKILNRHGVELLTREI